jgi:hypothetical protein
VFVCAPPALMNLVWPVSLPQALFVSRDIGRLSMLDVVRIV